MAYNIGFLNKRVTILAREEATDGAFGRTGGQFKEVQTVWANCSYTKGIKAMREGAFDAYETYMVRMMWHAKMKRECRLSWGGKTYQVESLKEDKEANEMQAIVTELVQ